MSGKSTLIRNANVFGPEPMGRRDLWIVGERIAAVAEGLPAIPGALPHEEIDLTGLTVIPGLIDAHVHLSGGGGKRALEQGYLPLS